MSHRSDEPEVNITTINDIVNQWALEPGTPSIETLKERLVNREDAIVEVLHLAGAQFGLYPQIVAEVIAEVGLGTPKSIEERAMIRRSFVALMEELQRQQGS